MTDVLAFAAASPTLTAPTIDEGLPDGFVIQVWIRRTGGEKSQPIVTIAGSKTKMVLGTGERGDVLSFGVAGDAKSTMTAAGALPIERWVPVRLVVKGDGDASISVLGRQVAAGKVTALGSEARTITIGGGALGFEMAEVQIWRRAAPSSGALTLEAPDLWAFYPLASIEVAGQGWVTRDAGPKGRHAAASAAGTVVRHDEEFDPGPSPCARFDGDSEDTRMSALGGIGRQLALEAWVCPEVDDGAPPSVVRIGEESGKVVLAAGGSKGRLAVIAVVGTQAVSVLGIDGVVPKGEWHHVAASVVVEATKATVELFVDGRRVKSASLGVKTSDVGLGISVPTGGSRLGEFTAISGAVGGSLTTVAILGGAARGCSRFRGGMAEVRVWRRVSADAIASGWLSRVRGDEDGLAACYRLDDAESGQFVDISGRRGVAKVASGVVASEAGPPLAATRAARTFMLRARGKLSREHVPVSAFEGVPVGFAGFGGASGARALCSVFDATILVARQSGAGLWGRRLLVRVDSPVLALVGAGEAAKATQWERGKTYAVPIAGAGTVRLRFLASESRCPTVRVQVEGAAGGIWTAIEPDSRVQATLRGITGARLLTPGHGRPSPLPAGATQDDADALAESLRRVATVMPRRAPRRAPATKASAPAKSGGLGISKLSWGDVGGTFEDAWDGTKDVYDDVVDGVSDGVDEVSDGVDSVVQVTVDASIDVSKVATGTASEVVKGAGTATKAASSLVKRADDEVSALRTKAAGASAWVGKEAIRTLVRSADALAVVVDAAAAGRWVEVVGTSIVDGAEVAWRAIVAGVDDALAAAESLAEKVGAKLAEWLEYLAYLFNWGDFVKESDAMTELLEAALTSARGQIAGLMEVKEELVGTLRGAIDAAVGQRSLADLCGLKIDRGSRAYEQVDYVLECFQQVLDAADSALPAVKSAPALAECSASVLSSADRCGAALPMTSLGEVVAMLTTPVAELCAGKDDAADGSTSLVDYVFDATIGKGVAAFDAGLEALRSRISIGWMTSLMEDVVLCGRKFTVLRVLALIAAIPSVVEAKTGGSGGSGGSVGQAKSASIDGVVGTTKDASSPAERQAAVERRRTLWLNMAAGLINSVTILAKTGAELAGKKMRALTAVMGICSFCRGYATTKLLASFPKKTRAVTKAGALFDVVSGAWSMVYGAAANDKRPWLDKVDAGVQVLFCVGVTVNGVVGFTLASGGQSSAVASYALRVGSWAGTALVRAVERFDDDPSAKKMKYFTLGLTAVVVAADIAEAVYGNVQDVEATA